MKGDSCGFLHQFDAARMPTCRTLLRYGVCKEPDCPYKHTLDDIKVWHMLLSSGWLLVYLLWRVLEQGGRWMIAR